MIPVMQTKVVVRNSEDVIVQNGNCYAAVIASMLEVPITEVPNVEVFFKWDNGPWLETMLTYLNLMGWELYTNQQFEVFHKPHSKQFDDDGIKEQAIKYCTDKLYLVSGASRRGVSHICIFKNGKLIHDPHPTKEGILTYETFQELLKV